MVALAAPDADGRIIHEVQPYQALITIADAYHVTVDRILELNGLQADWTLSVGQKLVISPGNITPSPTLSAIQKLTPAADGKYYHTIHSGETLLWIANRYEVPLADLMNWNGLNNASVIYADQKLLLLITPPATPTLTPAPPTSTPSPTASVTQSPPTATPPDTATESSTQGSNLGLIIGVIVIGLAIGGLLWWQFSKRN
jgi:LysM repeat protein